MAPHLLYSEVGLKPTGYYMKKALLALIVLSFAVTACGKKSFESSQLAEGGGDDNFDDYNDDDVINPPPPNDDDGNVVCPRYDLIIDSTDQSTARRNYRFNFNSEMKQTTAQGEIDIIFQTNRYANCSGEVRNNNIATNLKPLNLTEDLTKQVVINVGRVCALMVPQIQQTIRVIDTATGKVLFDEQKLRQTIGSCEFGYTTAGQNIRNQLIQFANAIADRKAAPCN